MEKHIEEGLSIIKYITDNNLIQFAKHNAFDIPAEERDQSIEDSLKALVKRESSIFYFYIFRLSRKL